jgi:FtsZ-binding cell division protein ZapB
MDLSGRLHQETLKLREEINDLKNTVKDVKKRAQDFEETTKVLEETNQRLRNEKNHYSSIIRSMQDLLNRVHIMSRPPLEDPRRHSAGGHPPHLCRG